MSNKEWFATYKPNNFGVVYQVYGVTQRIMENGRYQDQDSRWQ
jgi:hypothetical protein